MEAIFHDKFQRGMRFMKMHWKMYKEMDKKKKISLLIQILNCCGQSISHCSCKTQIDDTLCAGVSGKHLSITL